MSPVSVSWRAVTFALALSLAVAFAPLALGAFGPADDPTVDRQGPHAEDPIGPVDLASDDDTTAGKDPLAHISSCDTGPPLAGMGQCSFTCSAENAGSYGVGVGTITMTCGDMECSVGVPEFTGCDLLGVERGTVGICRFEGTGVGWCGAF